MALDTQEKRINAVKVGRPWLRAHLAVGTPDEQWRISAANAYGGNALSPVAAGDIIKRVGSGGLVGTPGGLVG